MQESTRTPGDMVCIEPSLHTNERGKIPASCHAVKKDSADTVTFTRGGRDIVQPGLRRFGLSEDAFLETVAKAQQPSSMKGDPSALTNERLRAILTHTLD